MICRSMFQVYFESIKNLVIKYTSSIRWTCFWNARKSEMKKLPLCKSLRFWDFSHKCSNSDVYLRKPFSIYVFVFRRRGILDVDFQNRCIYFETQKYAWSRFSKLTYLSSNSEVCLKYIDFQSWCVFSVTHKYT